MKKIIIVLSFLIPIISVAQKQNVQNAYRAFNAAEKSKDDNYIIEKYIEAKSFIDQAYNTESTSNDPKMWFYRSKIYLEIAHLKDQSIDVDAIFKATEAHLKCLQIKDPNKKKPKIIVNRLTSKEDVVAGLVRCGYKLWNLGVIESSNGNYSRALKLYDAINNIFSKDENDQLKRGNITQETVLYNSFVATKAMKDNTKTKQLLQQLIDLNYNEPRIYVYMSDIYIEEGNTDKALEFLSLGRDMFENDQILINQEINLYIKLGRTSELIEKLGEAIELDPENDILYFNRGTIYDQEGDSEKAKNDYNKSLEINPDAFGANYNLGAMYFNLALELNNKANSTSDNSVYKSLKDKAKKFFDQALPYLEKAYEINGEDKNTLLSLKQLYYMNGDYKKSEEMKQKLADLK